MIRWGKPKWTQTRNNIKKREAWNKGQTKDTNYSLLVASERQKANAQNGQIFKGKTKFYYDLNKSFRSKWEANFARILNVCNIKWEYESSKCRFHLGDLGVMIIDFYLPDFDMYVEVKGYLTPKALGKMRRFQELHPEKKIKVVERETYKKLLKMFGM